LVSAGERVPIRLVKENGGTISLDATSIDMVVERQQSNFALPFMSATKMGIDLNQAAVSFEVQGVFADDSGQEESSQATLDIDFFQEQSIIGFTPELADLAEQKGGGPFGGGSGADTKGGSSGRQKGGTGERTGSRGATPFNPVMQRTPSVLDGWHGKTMDLPVGYWLENAASTNLPYTTGLQLWLKAGDITGSHGSYISSWPDGSGFSRHFTQGTAANQPRLLPDATNGHNAVAFDGTDDYLTSSFISSLNGANMTVFAVYAPGDTDSAETNGVFTSKVSTAGYGIRYNADDDATGVGITTELESSSNTVEPEHKPNITSATLSANSTVLRLNGLQVDTSSDTYTPLTSGSAHIGADFGSSLQNYFKGHIYEIIVYNSVLSTNDIMDVEGYLANKYNLSYQLAGNHAYVAGPYNLNTDISIGVSFDAGRVGSKKEPYYYVNRTRVTDMVVGSVSGDTITVTGADPRDWFELTNSTTLYHVNFYQQSVDEKITSARGYGIVTAATSDSFTITRVADMVGKTISANMRVVMEPVGNSTTHNTPSRPVIIIPIKNANIIYDVTQPELVLGPYYPAFQGGAARGADYGLGIQRTDEFLAFMVSKALSESRDFASINAGSTTTRSWLALQSHSLRPVNAAGSNNISDVFSTEILESANGNNARVRVTQVHATSLGEVANKIVHNFNAVEVPVLHGFTGGKAGKKVKSGGDKAQDILGILANSQNMTTLHNTAAAGLTKTILDFGSTFVQQTLYEENNMGDYITGIQIPYDTLITFGEAAEDLIVAQRNHFLTTKTSTNTTDKISNVNTQHASGNYSLTAGGHLKNGISGLVTSFNVNRDAEMKAYEFALKFVAADIIM
jgi:hypothetical protein